MAIIGNPWAQDAGRFGQAVGNNLVQGMIQLPQQRYMMALQQAQMAQRQQQLALQNMLAQQKMESEDKYRAGELDWRNKSLAQTQKYNDNRLNETKDWHSYEKTRPVDGFVPNQQGGQPQVPQGFSPNLSGGIGPVPQVGYSQPQGGSPSQPQMQQQTSQQASQQGSPAWVKPPVPMSAYQAQELKLRAIANALGANKQYLVANTMTNLPQSALMQTSNLNQNAQMQVPGLVNQPSAPADSFDSNMQRAQQDLQSPGVGIMQQGQMALQRGVPLEQVQAWLRQQGMNIPMGAQPQQQGQPPVRTWNPTTQSLQ